MFIRIEKASAVPISRQIADQIRAQAMARTFGPGYKLPSVRQLARDIGVNQNTVLHVYERLTGEGLLERRHGDGTYISDSPPTHLLDRERDQLAGELEQLVRRARMLGLTREQLHEIIDKAITESLQNQSTAHDQEISS